jgi:hypothetical protein
MREAWREAIKQEGFMSSYRGFGVALASTLVYKGVVAPCLSGILGNEHGASCAWPVYALLCCLSCAHWTIHSHAASPSSGLYFGLYDTAKAYVIGDEQSAKPATSAGGLTLRTGLAAATTYVSASISCKATDARSCRLLARIKFRQALASLPLAKVAAAIPHRCL